MWRGYVIHQLLYILHCAMLCVYMLYPRYDIWLCTTTSHTILIYYNNYYYDNSNSYLFLFFIFIIVLLCVCVCVYVLCGVVSLVCVCVLSCVSSHMLIHVYLCVFTPPHPPGLCCSEEANALIYRGGIFREKIFTKFGKWVYQVKTDRKSILDLEKR